MSTCLTGLVGSNNLKKMIFYFDWSSVDTENSRKESVNWKALTEVLVVLSKKPISAF